MKTRGTQNEKGFTLVELIVAVGLFSVVMLVSVSALLSLVGANRKAQSLQSVMNNLNIALDGMVRSIRMGTTYHCDGATYTLLTTVRNCADGDVLFAFEPFGGSSSNNGDQWVYAFIPPSGASSGYIQRSEDSGATWLRLTAPEVSIDEMKFYVAGSTEGDFIQPKVVLELQGTVAGGTRAYSTFHIQATAVQRVLDI
jgi:prepilin-type N-terminal cleavage/methylation domain-containing protein